MTFATTRAVCSVLLAGMALCTVGFNARAASTLDGIDHVIVIYQENWSFDGLYGKFPGANGLARAGDAARQVDKNGRPYATLPPPMDTRSSPHAPDSRFPTNLPNAPFDLEPFVPPFDSTGDLLHGFYQEQYQVDGGRMDKFVAWSDAGGLVMSYYDATGWPVGLLAQQFVLADNFFHAAFGDSFLNHQWLICACTPRWPDAPASVRIQLDEHGVLMKGGQVTPDGYVVEESYSRNSPRPAWITDPNLLMPSQTQPTIGDRLSERGVSWAWYAGGWSQAVKGHPDTFFKFHHQPFVYYANYAEGTPGRTHLRDEQDLDQDLRRGTLPAVSFVKFLGEYNEHPTYAIVPHGQSHVAGLVRAVMTSHVWPTTVIIITYDENGGRWDHLAPPKGDRWGPGTRVPAIIISPLAKRHYVDHTVYDTTSILKTIEVRWQLAPLGTRDATANDLSNALQ
jgi:phospholipase C